MATVVLNESHFYAVVDDLRRLNRVFDRIGLWSSSRDRVVHDLMASQCGSVLWGICFSVVGLSLGEEPLSSSTGAIGHSGKSPGSPSAR